MLLTEWIVEFEKIANKKKSVCKERIYKFNQDQTDCVWMIWDAILFQTTKKSHLTKLVRALLDLFTLDNNMVVKRKKYMMYFAVSL